MAGMGSSAGTAESPLAEVIEVSVDSNTPEASSDIDPALAAGSKGNFQIIINLLVSASEYVESSVHKLTKLVIL